MHFYRSKTTKSQIISTQIRAKKGVKFVLFFFLSSVDGSSSFSFTHHTPNKLDGPLIDLVVHLLEFTFLSDFAPFASEQL